MHHKSVKDLVCRLFAAPLVLGIPHLGPWQGTSTSRNPKYSKYLVSLVFAASVLLCILHPRPWHVIPYPEILKECTRNPSEN